MKIGTLDIKKAYLGALELTHSNAFIGTYPVIPDEQIEPYFYLDFSNSSVNGTIQIRMYSSNSSYYITNGFDNYSTMYYSYDKTNWTQIQFGHMGNMSSATTINADKGRVYFKGSVTTTAYISATHAACACRQFMITGDNVVGGGQIASLFENNASTGEYTLKTYTTSYSGTYQTYYAYCGEASYMFRDCTAITDFSKAIMPNGTSNTTNQSADGPCKGMFLNCTNLIKAPYLPATTLSDAAYDIMFENCSSLTEVKCNATTFGTNATFYWLDCVSASGTFYKNVNATWKSGVSGIPSGWTTQNL